jgi:hypothetical protein
VSFLKWLGHDLLTTTLVSLDRFSSRRAVDEGKERLQQQQHHVLDPLDTMNLNAEEGLTWADPSFGEEELRNPSRVPVECEVQVGLLGGGRPGLG